MSYKMTLGTDIIPEMGTIKSVIFGSKRSNVGEDLISQEKLSK